MRLSSLVVALAAGAALTACGGGDGGPSRTPAPTPAPSPAPSPSPSPTPAPTPAPATSFDTLSGSYSFTANAERARTTFTSEGGVTVDSTVEVGGLDIAYDQAADRFTVGYGILSGGFGAAERLAERFEGETVFVGDRSALYLSRAPYYYDFTEGPVMRDHVATAMWQLFSPRGETATTTWTVAVYGYPSAPGDVPTSGQAHFLADVVGFMAVGGEEIAVVQGLADFVVDFATGDFRLTGYMEEASAITGGGAGGALQLAAGGSIDADGHFGGYLTYHGLREDLAGTISGGFYGPEANELGATFSATNGPSTLIGTVTGHKTNYASTSEGIGNLGLVSPRREERYQTFHSTLDWRETATGTDWTSSGLGGSGLVTFGPDGVRSLYGHTLDPASEASGDAAFRTYEMPWDASGDYPMPARLRTYRIGAENPELQLTYASFGQLRVAYEPGSEGQQYHETWFVWGDRTPEYLTLARTGIATYRGLAYGSAQSIAHGAFEVDGSADFTVDFSSLRYSAALDLTGHQGGEIRDLGVWVFAGENLGSSVLATSPYAEGTGAMQIGFFGPTAQELGAAFSMRTGDQMAAETISIAGAALAIEQ